MGIPRDDTAEMTGTMNPTDRQKAWRDRRVFFLTPQDVKCLVIDEAHKALGNHAYCQVVRELVKYTRQFRVLALSATPGSDMKAVQQPYTHERTVDKIVVPLGDELNDLKKKYIQVLSVVVRRLTQQRVLYNREPTSLSKFLILKAREAFRQNPPENLPRSQYGVVEGDFALAMSLYHGYELLQLHGLRSLYNFLQGVVSGDKAYGRTRTELMRNADFCTIMDILRDKFQPSIAGPDQKGTSSKPKGSFAVGHPKMVKLEQVVVDHFNKCQAEGHATRVMIFSQYRDSVQEITQMLQQHEPLVKVMSFIGQSSAGKATKGFTQKEQLKVMQAFRTGGYNTLVSTCVGEEGLDIGDVDLIVCFDAHKSPIRLVQRMGRTGRKRQGRIVMLVTEGKEEQIYNHSQYTKRSIHRSILNGAKSLIFYPSNPRMIPVNLTPACHRMHITVQQHQDKGKGAGKGRKSQGKISSLFSKAKSGAGRRPAKEEAGISLEEFAELKSSGAAVTTQYLPAPKMVTLQSHDEEDCDKVGLEGELNFSDWLPWQNSLQQTSQFGHSQRSRHLVELLEFTDLQQVLPPEEDNYGQEMRIYLNMDDVISDSSRPVSGDITQFCVPADKCRAVTHTGDEGTVEPQSKKGKKTSRAKLPGKRKRTPFPVLEIEEDSDSDALPDVDFSKPSIIKGQTSSPSITSRVESRPAMKATSPSHRKEKRRKKSKPDRSSLLSMVVSSTENDDFDDFEPCGGTSRSFETGAEAESEISKPVQDASHSRVNPSVDSPQEICDDQERESEYVADVPMDTIDSFDLEKHKSEGEEMSADSKTNEVFRVPTPPPLENVTAILTRITKPEDLQAVDLHSLLKNCAFSQSRSIRGSQPHMSEVLVVPTDAYTGREVQIDDVAPECREDVQVRETADDRPADGDMSLHLDDSFSDSLDEVDFDLISERLLQGYQASNKPSSSDSHAPNKTNRASKVKEPCVENGHKSQRMQLSQAEPKSKKPLFKECGDSSVQVLQPVDSNKTDSASSTKNGIPKRQKTSFVYRMDESSTVSNSLKESEVHAWESQRKVKPVERCEENAVMPPEAVMVESGVDAPDLFSPEAVKKKNPPQSKPRKLILKTDKSLTEGPSLLDMVDTPALFSPEVKERSPSGPVWSPMPGTERSAKSDSILTFTQALACVHSSSHSESSHADSKESHSDSRQSHSDSRENCTERKISKVDTPTDTRKVSNIESVNSTVNVGISARSSIPALNAGSENTDNTVGEGLLELEDSPNFDLGFDFDEDIIPPSPEAEPSVSQPGLRSQLSFKTAVSVPVVEAPTATKSLLDHVPEALDFEDDDILLAAHDENLEEHHSPCFTSSFQCRNNQTADVGKSKVSTPKRKEFPEEHFTSELLEFESHTSESRHSVCGRGATTTAPVSSQGFTCHKQTDNVDDDEDSLSVLTQNKISYKSDAPVAYNMDTERNTSGACTDIATSKPVKKPQLSLAAIGTEPEGKSANSGDDLGTFSPHFVLLHDLDDEFDDDFGEMDVLKTPAQKKSPPSVYCSTPLSNKKPARFTFQATAGDTPTAPRRAHVSHTALAEDDGSDFEESIIRRRNVKLKGRQLHSSESEDDRSPGAKVKFKVPDKQAKRKKETATFNKKKKRKALYLKSVRSPVSHGHAQGARFRLQYNHAARMDVFSQPPRPDEEESQYQEDSFCVGSEEEDEDEEEESYETGSEDDDDDFDLTALERQKPNDDEDLHRLPPSQITPAPKRPSAVRALLSSSDDLDTSVPEKSPAKSEQVASVAGRSEYNRQEDGSSQGFRCALPEEGRSASDLSKATALSRMKSSEYVRRGEPKSILGLAEEGKALNSAVNLGHTAPSREVRSDQRGGLCQSQRRIQAVTPSSSTAVVFPSSSSFLPAATKGPPHSASRQNLASSRTTDSFATSTSSSVPSLSVPYISPGSVSKTTAAGSSGSINTRPSSYQLTNAGDVRNDAVDSSRSSLQVGAGTDHKPSDSVKFTSIASRERGKVVILVDSREISGAQDIVSALRLQHNAYVCARQLTACDYILSNRMAVERLTWSGFSTSTNRNKLCERVQQMQALYDRCVIIVEKDRVKPGEEKSARPQQHSKYVDSIIAQLSHTSVRVFFTENQGETAKLLAGLSNSESRKSMAISAPVNLNQEKEQVVKFYLSVPMLNITHALNLCLNFHSVNDFLQSPVTEIQKKGHMSFSRAQEVYNFIRHRFSAALMSSS
ncbi:hypothetical protein BaRGS_00003161 [Batillaria attramentaria]|uniref:Fanconi anemia group M protein n=1 Tax=Batillaria attramentaria TaxID=370345 RepID=A0ABD0M1N7_9CAEN